MTEDGSTMTKEFYGHLCGIFGPIWWNKRGIVVE
jgi:hypothetical protein